MNQITLACTVTLFSSSRFALYIGRLRIDPGSNVLNAIEYCAALASDKQEANARFKSSVFSLIRVPVSIDAPRGHATWLESRAA